MATVEPTSENVPATHPDHERVVAQKQSSPPPPASPKPTRSAPPVSPLTALETVALVRLCTVQQVMMMLDYSYDRASRELDRLVKDGFIERIKRFAPRGEGSLPVTYILNATGARYLGQRGHDLEELLRVAKNLSAHRRALEDNLPTQDRHRAFASMLATIIMCAARRIDPSAQITDVRFDRELTLPVDLKPFLAVIPDRDRLLISPDPTKTEVTYIPDFSFVLHWTLDGRALTEPVFGEVETGYGERNPKDLAIGKAWKLRAVQRLFENGTTIGKQQFAAGTMPRVLVWSRTPALEQGFFDGARTVYKDAFSPLWLTNGDVLPLGIPKGTKKTEIAFAVRKLVDNVQTKAWRWLRFPDPANRRRLVGVQERGGR